MTQNKHLKALQLVYLIFMKQENEDTHRIHNPSLSRSFKTIVGRVKRKNIHQVFQDNYL